MWGKSSKRGLLQKCWQAPGKLQGQGGAQGCTGWKLMGWGEGAVWETRDQSCPTGAVSPQGWSPRPWYSDLPVLPLTHMLLSPFKLKPEGRGAHGDGPQGSASEDAQQDEAGWRQVSWRGVGRHPAQKPVKTGPVEWLLLHLFFKSHLWDIFVHTLTQKISFSGD